MAKRSNGEGTIFKRKDGRWCGAYYDDTYKRRFVYGKTQAEVKQKLKEKQSNRTTTAKAYTLQSWIYEYLEKYKKNELKVTTYGSYVTLCRKHIASSWIGEKKIDKLSTVDLQKFYNEKQQAGYNSKTIRHISVIISTALDQAVKLRMIPENPNKYVTLPKKTKYHADVLSKEEVEKIVNEAKDDNLYPIVITTIYTGMRKGEVMALSWDCIDFENRQINIRKSLCRVDLLETDENGKNLYEYRILEPKTELSKRTIPMLPQVYEALKIQQKMQADWKEKNAEVYSDQGLVFTELDGNYIRQRAFMDRYHAFLDRYGIRDIRFHDLRHTFATLLLEADVSMKVVQEMLGHSTITTSMDIYSHVSDAKKVQAIEKLLIEESKL